MNDRENVISGLRHTVEMFLFDPATGYTKDPDDLNAADRITFDACVGAIDLLKEQNERIEKMRSLLGEADEEIKRLKSKDKVLQFGDNPIT